MKYWILTIACFLTQIPTLMACDVCEKQQPEILQGITHGTGPQSNWDLLIVSIIALIVLLSLVLSLKYLIKPGEKNSNHIKHSILS